MRTIHDQIAKQLLQLMLEEVGKVEVALEVAPEAQQADVAFEPDPGKREQAAILGLLGRMTRQACFLEPFRKTPPIEELQDCIAKLFGARRIQRNLRKREPSAVLTERVWLLSPGLPVKAMRELELSRRNPKDPPGLYHAAPV